MGANEARIHIKIPQVVRYRSQLPYNHQRTNAPVDKIQHSSVFRHIIIAGKNNWLDNNEKIHCR